MNSNKNYRSIIIQSISLNNATTKRKENDNTNSQADTQIEYIVLIFLSFLTRYKTKSNASSRMDFTT